MTKKGYRLKTGKTAEQMIDIYKKIEDSVVGCYKKVEEKFVEKFLEPIDSEDENIQ